MRELWGVSERGNFEGKNILNVPRRSRTRSQRSTGIALDELESIAAEARATLYAAREARVHPGARRQDSRRVERAHGARARRGCARVRRRALARSGGDATASFSFASWCATAA